MPAYQWSYTLDDSLEVYHCTMEISMGEDVKSCSLRGPRIFLEHEIMNAIQAMHTAGTKGKVTVTRPVRFFSQLTQSWVQRENRLEFEVGT